MRRLLQWLKQLVVELDTPRPVEDVDKVLMDAIREYGMDSPRLYRVHRDFFEAAVKAIDEALPKVARKLWQKYPKGKWKSFYLCWPNKLSRWTYICIRVRTTKQDGRIMVDSVMVDKIYRPGKYATYITIATEPDVEEMVRKLERMAEF